MPLTINNPVAAGTNAINSNAQGTITRKPTVSFAAGDLMLVSVAFGLASTPSTITVTDDAGGNTYTLATATADKTTNNTAHAWLFYSMLATPLTAANTVTVTFGSNVNFPQLILAKATVTSGVWNTPALDQNVAATGASAAPSSGSTPMTTTANELLWGLIEIAPQETLTWTAFTDLTSQGTTGRILHVGYQVVSSTGAYAAAGSMTSADWAAVIGTFAVTAVTPPANTVAPAVTGTTTVGQTLSTTNGTWTGSPTSFSYQWQRDNQGGGSYSNIGSATATSYMLVDADDACNVRCVVTATNSGGSTAANSNSVGTVVEPAPVNTAAPLISGSAPQGSTLSCGQGSWSHMGGLNPSYAYQWTRDGSNIAAATASTYTTVSADIGHAVGCTVTATNTGGSTAQASSNTVTVTGATVAPTTVAVTLAGASMYLRKRNKLLPAIEPPK